MAELLATRGLPPEQLDVFTATQERVPRARYSREHAARGGRWLDHDALLDLVLRARGSLVLNALDAHDPGLSALADQLHAWSGQRVNINAYFTPRAGKTFGWHWDGHDVFIVQVEGRKRWRLFEPAMQHPLADGSAAAFHERRERWPSMDHLGKALAGWLMARDVAHDIAGFSLRPAWLGAEASASSDRMCRSLARRRTTLISCRSVRNVRNCRRTMRHSGRTCRSVA